MLASCPSNKNENEFVSLSKGSLFGAGSEGFSKENIVIESQENWKTFLSKLDSSNEVSKQFENKIDFSKSTIIAVFEAVKSSGGNSIEVAKIEPKKNVLEIHIATKAPKPTDMVTMAIEQPYHIIKINKTKKKITFK